MGSTGFLQGTISTSSIAGGIFWRLTSKFLYLKPLFCSYKTSSLGQDAKAHNHSPLILPGCPQFSPGFLPLPQSP